MALTPSLRAAWPLFPRAIPSITISPFSAMAGCIPVGSPTMATSIFGRWGSASEKPFCPLTSSSHEARYTRLYGTMCCVVPSRSILYTCNRLTSPPPQSLEPSPYRRPSSMVGVNGSRVHEATGFTVSMWAFNSRVGLAGSSSSWIRMLLPMRWQGSSHFPMKSAKMSAAAPSSRLTEGVLMRRASSSTASSVYLFISIIIAKLKNNYEL